MSTQTKRRRQVEQVIGAIGLGGTVTPRRVEQQRQAARRETAEALRAAIVHDGPTPELSQHHQLIDHIVQVGDKPVGVVKRVITQWPLDRYKARGEISHTQWRAGDRLRQVFERTGVEPRVISRYEPDVVQNSAKAWDVITDGQDAAHAELRAAILAVGMQLSSVLFHVCCAGGTATDWAANRFQYRGRQAIGAGMASLKMGLDGLIRHFNL